MRPQSITVLCVLLFAMGASLSVRFVVQFAVAPNFFSFLLLVICLVALYTYYGLWNMRQWSILLFLCVWGSLLVLLLFIAPEITLILMMRAFYIVCIILVFLIVVLPHRDKFSSGPVWQPRKSEYE